MSRSLCAGAAAALLATAPAAAQDRTGPQAAPPPLPAFPQAPAPRAPQASPGAPLLGSTAAAAPLRDIRAAVEGPAGVARPPRGWRPPEAQGSSLRLEHAPREALDEGWVRRQFALNGLPADGGAPRALALVQHINRAFLSAGFINSGLVVRPAADAGVLELRILYGGLAASADGAPPVRVAWTLNESKGLTEAYVRDRLPSAGRRPLSALDLERDFRLLAEDPAIRTVNADLRPGSRPGEASLLLSVYPQDRYDLYVTAANNRSPSVGGERLALGGSARSLLAAGDLLTAEAGITEGLEDISVGYALPFLSPRTTLSVRGALNDAAIVAPALVPLDIQARDRSAEVGLVRKVLEAPLLPGGEPGRWRSARTLSVGALVTHRVSRTYLLGQPFSFSPGSVNGRSEYTAVRLIGDYVVRNVDQVFAVSVTATRGLDGTRSDVPGLPTPKDGFHALLAQVNYARRLSDDGLELRARLSGQVSDSVLYSGERLSAGGESTVRGYRENLLLGDKGVIGSVEIARPFSLSGRRAAGRSFDWGAFAASVFADGAYVRNHRPPHPESRIYSVGASLAWTPSDAVSARITYGHALRDVEVAGNKDIQDRGWHGRLTVRPLRLLRR